MMKHLEVVCGIIMKNDKFFIAKRKSDINDGTWEFPGGKVEQNETNEDAVIRELLEECNIHVKVVSYLTTIHDTYKDFEFNVHAYLCEIVSGEIKLNAHYEYAWVKAIDLYQYSFSEADKPILDLLND